MSHIHGPLRIRLSPQKKFDTYPYILPASVLTMDCVHIGLCNMEIDSAVLGILNILDISMTKLKSMIILKSSGFQIEDQEDLLAACTTCTSFQNIVYSSRLKTVQSRQSQHSMIRSLVNF